MLGALDRWRGRALEAFGPLVPSLLRDRERRIAVYGLAAVAIAFAATFAAPVPLLALGPLVLGVPHLVADVRYLVARPRLHRRVAFWLAVAAPACVAWIAPHAWIALLAPAGAALAARASWRARAVVALGAGGLAVVAAAHERAADLVLAHAHNAIALAIFVVWSRRTTRLHLAVVVAFAAGAIAIAAGALDGVSVASAGILLDTIAPLEDPRLAARALLLFVFAQSVHYAVWLRLVPEADRPRPGLRSFSSSLAALRGDLGAAGLVLAALASGALIVWAAISIAAARDGYLRLAAFHGPLELGAAALLLLESGTLHAWTKLRPPTVPATSAET